MANASDKELFEVNKDVITANTAAIRKIMENVIKLDVPLNVDIHPGRNWHEAKEKEEKTV